MDFLIKIRPFSAFFAKLSQPLCSTISPQYNVPCRAFRVGATQSKISIPFATTSMRSCGCNPTPMLYRILFSGKKGPPQSIISAVEHKIRYTMGVGLHPQDLIDV